MGNLISGFARSVIMGQVRTYLPWFGGLLTALGVANKVDPSQFEGAVYYLANSLWVIVPAYFSYTNKKSVKDLVTQAANALPRTSAANAAISKVS